MQANVGDPEAVRRLFHEPIEALGMPDLLVANAGQAMSGMPMAEMDNAKFEQLLRVDLMAPLFDIREFILARKAAGASC